MIHHRWSEPHISEVEWRDKYAPEYVDHALIEQALALPPSLDNRPGIAMLCCEPEQHSVSHPGPPYRYWVARVLMLDLTASRERATIVAVVMTSHGMYRDEDTADSVRMEYLATVSRFVSRSMQEENDAAA